MRGLLFVLMVSLAGPALAQYGGKARGQGKSPQGQNMSHEERQRLRQDVDSARGNYGRPEPRRQDRMAPEEREKLRRDVQDANREMRRR